MLLSSPYSEIILIKKKEKRKIYRKEAGMAPINDEYTDAHPIIGTVTKKVKIRTPRMLSRIEIEDASDVDMEAADAISFLAGARNEALVPLAPIDSSTHGMALAESESTMNLKRQRDMDLMNFFATGKQAKMVGTGASGGGGANCTMLLIRTPKKNELSPNAPLTFKGYIVTSSGANPDAVEVPHQLGAFEKGFPEYATYPPRPPTILPLGSPLDVSCFKTNDFQNTFKEGCRVRITGLTTSIQVANKDLQVDGVDEGTNTRGKVDIRKTGDCYMTFSAGTVEYMDEPTYEEKLVLLGNVPNIGANDFPNVRILPWPDIPDDVAIRDEIFVLKGRAKVPERLTNVRVPFHVKSEILLSRSYPFFPTALHLDNSLMLHDTLPELEDVTILTEAISSIPDPNESNEIFYETKKSPGLKLICLRGAEKQCMLATLRRNSRGFGLSRVVFFDDEIKKFGLSSCENWASVCSQIVRSLDAIVIIDLDVDKSRDYQAPHGDPKAQIYDNHGTARFLSINYQNTIQRAALEVTREFAHTVLMNCGENAIKKPKRGLVYSASDKNPNAKKLRDGGSEASSVDIMLMNEWQGDYETVLLDEEWAYYVMPPCNAYPLAHYGDHRSITKEQGFYEMNQAKATASNEKFIQDKWVSVEVFKRELKVFAVRRPANGISSTFVA